MKTKAVLRASIRRVTRHVLSVVLALALMLSHLPLSVQAEEAFSVPAPAALLMDYDSGSVLYEQGGHEQRPCASITKVMTLCLVFEALEDGRLAYDKELTASAHAASMGGSDIWLTEGESMSVDDLIKATVIMSANDAAVVLAEAVSGSEEAFISEMNRKAQELGMNDTVFKNCNGLDEEGHLTSAYDVALMSRELMKYEKIYDYTLTWIDYLRDGETQLVNTNKMIKNYNGILGLKTGTTTNAGSCIAAAAERENLTMIAIVLGAESSDIRFKNAALLLDYGFANWKVTIPQNPDLDRVAVTGGLAREVKVVPAEKAPKLLLKAGEQADAETRVTLAETLEAPILSGDVVGRIDYVSNGETIGSVDIVAAFDIEKLSFESSFFSLLQSLFCG